MEKLLEVRGRDQAHFRVGDVGREPQDAGLHQRHEFGKDRHDADARHRIDDGEERAGFLRRNETQAYDRNAGGKQALDLAAPMGQRHAQIVGKRLGARSSSSAPTVVATIVSPASEMLRGCNPHIAAWCR